MTTHRQATLVFGTQLFAAPHLAGERRHPVVMVEDEAMCRRRRWHRQKLAFVLAAMRAHADDLRRAGFDVHYHPLEAGLGWQDAVDALRRSHGITRLRHFEVESPALERALRRYASRHGLTRRVLDSPMFLTSRSAFAEHLEGRRGPSLLPFYRSQRRRHGILVTANGGPVGGRWSFDQDNRRKLPRGSAPPPPPVPAETDHARAATRLVNERFPDHPGSLETRWLPTTRQQAGEWLDEFLAHRFGDFGAYEDALTRRSVFVYHSALSPLLNVGLLTPGHVLERALEHAAAHAVPLNSLEGFVRQILGWREFVRGVYQHFHAPLQRRNVWDADRRLTAAWYDGTTGIDPLDHVIDKTVSYGWAHHIERLMVVANLMNLSGIHPQDVYGWFMEMFVDAYDWVMAPNVFGMGLSSEGGIFTSKPYVCGSNYLLKMGDFKRGPWCEVMDGLLWRFVARHEKTLKANQRLAPMVANLPRVARSRPRIFSRAEAFIEATTAAA